MISKKANMFFKLGFIFLFIFSFLGEGYCQNDTSVVEVGDTLYKKFNRGFYNSYTDFLNNAPSFISEFTVEEKTTDRLSKKNIYRVKYKLKKGEDKIKKNIWGFADDSLFYVRITTSIFSDFFLET